MLLVQHEIVGRDDMRNGQAGVGVHRQVNAIQFQAAADRSQPPPVVDDRVGPAESPGQDANRDVGRRVGRRILESAIHEQDVLVPLVGC